jgi:hypothetical protein
MNHQTNSRRPLRLLQAILVGVLVIFGAPDEAAAWSLDATANFGAGLERGDIEELSLESEAEAVEVELVSKERLRQYARVNETELEAEARRMFVEADLARGQTTDENVLTQIAENR